MKNNNKTFNTIEKIKKCKSATEVAVFLRSAFDGIYFHMDREKQSHTYEMMNLIFIEGIRQIEKIEKGGEQNAR